MQNNNHLHIVQKQYLNLYPKTENVRVVWVAECVRYPVMMVAYLSLGEHRMHPERVEIRTRKQRDARTHHAEHLVANWGPAPK